MSIELELPLFGVDEILVDNSTADLVVINRSPTPNETGIELTAVIEFDLVDATGLAAPQEAATQVFVTVDNGTDAPVEALAYDGAGGFQVGYTGILSLVSTPYVDARHFVIHPSVPFPSLGIITVRIETSAPITLSTSYIFTAEDLTTPIVQRADSNAKKTVRVIFDESVKQVSATGTDDALNPENYTFARLNTYPVPAVNVVATAVSTVSSQEVEVTIDIEITPGQPYSVTVLNVTDDAGNAVVAPFNVVSFLGYTPPKPATRNFDYFRMMPAINRTEDILHEFEAFCLCIQEVIDFLLCSIDEWTDILDVDKADEQYLDAMLCDMANPFDFDLSVVDKRRLIRVLLALYQQKGTIVGIQNVIRFFLGFEVEITPYLADGWLIGEGILGETTILAPGSSYNRFAFEVVVSQVITTEQEARLVELVNFMKPAQDHLARVVTPTTPDVVDHLELGLSSLGETWILH